MIEHKLTNFVLNTILLLLVATVALFLFWGLYPYEVIRFNSPTLEMQKNEYVVGEPLTFRTNYCKTGNYQATVVRTIRDGVIYLYPTVTTHSDEGCYDFISTTNGTPNVPTGMYTFQQEIIYHVNPIRDISYTISTGEFKITNNN